MGFRSKISVALDAVPETMLWTLYHRAMEARRPEPVLADPKAVDLLEAIDYPFEQRFGSLPAAQCQALRAHRFDSEVRRFLATHPDGTVVALGEGLETQFWRVDNGRVHWLSVDLAEASTSVPSCSDLARPPACRRLRPRQAWMDDVDPSRGVLLTAQGLLMYFSPASVAPV